MKNQAISSSDIGDKEVELENDSSNTAGGSWLVNLYQSLVIYFIGSLYFILNVLTEFMKSTIGEKALATLGMPIEDSDKKSIGGTGLLNSAAGAQQDHTAKVIVNQKVDKEHTILVVSDTKSEEIPPTPHTPKVEEEGVTATPYLGHAIEPSDEQSKNTLVIKNLPFKFKPTDLESLLSDNKANPKNVRMLRDEAGRFTGMAFIRCPSKEEAQRLIASMDGMDIGGRNIQVEFKMKKKKRSKLASSTDSASSLNSSSEEHTVGIPVNKIRTSGEHVINSQTSANNPIVVTNTNQQSYPQQRPVRKLAASAENMSARTSSNSSDDKFKKPPQIRRKSTSVFDTAPSSFYAHSAVPRFNQFASGPSIRPVRQPTGPDGKSNGFSDEYRRGRTAY